MNVHGGPFCADDGDVVNAGDGLQELLRDERVQGSEGRRDDVDASIKLIEVPFLRHVPDVSRQPIGSERAQPRQLRPVVISMRERRRFDGEITNLPRGQEIARRIDDDRLGKRDGPPDATSGGNDAVSGYFLEERHPQLGSAKAIREARERRQPQELADVGLVRGVSSIVETFQRGERVRGQVLPREGRPRQWEPGMAASIRSPGSSMKRLRRSRFPMKNCSCLNRTAFGIAVVPELWQIITVSSLTFLTGQPAGNDRSPLFPASAAFICRSPESTMEIFVRASVAGSKTKVSKPFSFAYCAAIAGDILSLMRTGIAPTLLSAR